MSALADLIDTADILGHTITLDARTGTTSITFTTHDNSNGPRSVPVANRGFTFDDALTLHSFDGRDDHHYVNVWTSSVAPDALVEHAHRLLLDLAFAAVAW